MTRIDWLFLALTMVALSIVLPNRTEAAEIPKRVEFRDLHGPDGRRVSLAAPRGGAIAIVFYSPECPISNAYSPTLNRMVKEAPAAKVRFVGVCVDPELADADVQAHAKDFALVFPVVTDRRGTLAAQLGATITPEVFVIDDSGRIRYSGRIDDQFVARQKANAHPETHELADALSAVLAGREVTVPRAKPVGCPLPEQNAGAAPPTYAREVSRILQKHCQECHRKGQVGPFALDTYEQARKRATDIAAITEDRSMPPWKPVPGVGPAFLHSRTLTKDEIATLAAWASAGAPMGNAADLPPAAPFPEGWALGTPDLILEPSEDFTIPAAGDDIYRCFVIPTKLPKDMFISAIEYQPGNRRVVHHMLAYVDSKGQARKRDEADPGPGYACFSGPAIEIHGDLGGWAPGNEPSRLPDGVGRSLPRGSDVVVQVHYHPNGKPETDRSRIGLYFARKPVKQTLHWAAAADLELKIPAGAEKHASRASWTAPVDVVAYAVSPHMHLLGRDMAVSVTFPDGRRQDLIQIADWDFAWQNTYYFAKPIELPRGSVVSLVAHFDNSSGNPRNPHNPPKPVSWGEATTDEMSIAFIAVTKKGQDLTQPGEVDDLQRILDRSEEAARAPGRPR